MTFSPLPLFPLPHQTGTHARKVNGMIRFLHHDHRAAAAPAAAPPAAASLLELEASLLYPIPNGCRHCGPATMEHCGFNDANRKDLRKRIIANNRLAREKEMQLATIDDPVEAEKLKKGEPQGTFNFLRVPVVSTPRRNCTLHDKEHGLSCVEAFMKLGGCAKLEASGAEGYVTPRRTSR
jgi:hypothetical protein